MSKREYLKVYPFLEALSRARELPSPDKELVDFHQGKGKWSATFVDTEGTTLKISGDTAVSLKWMREGGA